MKAERTADQQHRRKELLLLMNQQSQQTSHGMSDEYQTFAPATHRKALFSHGVEPVFRVGFLEFLGGRAVPGKQNVADRQIGRELFGQKVKLARLSLDPVDKDHAYGIWLFIHLLPIHIITCRSSLFPISFLSIILYQYAGSCQYHPLVPGFVLEYTIDSQKGNR